jgi:hypothetical protein
VSPASIFRMETTLEAEAICIPKAEYSLVCHSSEEQNVIFTSLTHTRATECVTSLFCEGKFGLWDKV